MYGSDCVLNKTLYRNTGGKLDQAHRPQFVIPPLCYTSNCLNVLELDIKYKTHPGIKGSRTTNFQKMAFYNVVWWESTILENRKTKALDLSLAKHWIFRAIGSLPALKFNSNPPPLRKS